MKKLVLGLVLVSLVFTAAPLLVSGQAPLQGCVLVRDVEYGQSGEPGHMECSEDQWVAPAGTTSVPSGVTAEEGVCPGDAWAVICLINVVNRAAQIIFYIMMGLVVGLVIIGGFFILTAGANEENVDKGKKFITFAIIGVAIAVFAYAVPAILSFVLGA